MNRAADELERLYREGEAAYRAFAVTLEFVHESEYLNVVERLEAEKVDLDALNARFDPRPSKENSVQ